jgi:hypothetical protein
LLFILGLLAAAPALCASAPQSYIDGTPQTKTDTHLYPVRIVAVDGDIPHTTPVAVTPGPHWLEIESPTAGNAGGKGAPKSQTFVLKIEPCTYYYVGAHKDSASLDKWKLVVDEEDTIKECDPAAELKKARDAQPPAAPKAHTPQ